MRLSLARHDELAREAVDAAGGHVFKHTGDGFGAAFESVSAGLETAAAMATALADEPWEGPQLASRFGVHSGEAEPQGGDYFGTTVTRTARLMDAGNGGQILVSESAHQLVNDRAPAGMAFVYAGEHRLKDLGEPVGVFRLVGSGAADERDLRTLESAPHNLPVQLSSFVGREIEIKQISELVRESRLVTLTGIGGVGKTRLSLQVVAEVLADFSDGAWFVELAPLAEAGLLPDAVANALNIPQDSTVPPLDRILTYLADSRMLVVIDNCEHLIDDVASLVDSLLRACPNVHVLAASREGLAVTGEVLWRVASLRVDDDAAAVELFADRARLVRPDFTISDDNRTAVGELCIRLDGIPLAIELATARLKMLSVEQVAEHLGDRFRLLTGGSRTAVERQRTLRAMMDWSYDLLSDNEQALLCRLAVFYDGFTLEAAEEVCSGDELPSFEVLDLLGHLVEASLVTFDEAGPRYRLLETVRQYSLDKLVDRGDADEARLRHATFFASVAEHIGSSLESGDSAVMETGIRELGNLRAAMTWALGSSYPVIALSIAIGIRQYFWNRTMNREALRWLVESLNQVEDDEVILVSRGVAYALTDANNVNDLAVRDALTPRAERLLARADDPISRADLSNSIATNIMGHDLREADRMCAQASLDYRNAGSTRWVFPLSNRTIVALNSGEATNADEILALVDQAEADGLEISTHPNVARASFLLLRGYYDEVIRFTEDLDPLDEWERAMFLFCRSESQAALGLLDEARSSIDEAEVLLSASYAGLTGWNAGMLEIRRGDVDEAVQQFHKYIRYADDPTNLVARAQTAGFYSIVAERRDALDDAAVLGGFAAALATAAHARLRVADRSLWESSQERVRNELGSERFEELFAIGASTGWDELPIPDRPLSN